MGTGINIELQGNIHFQGLYTFVSHFMNLGSHGSTQSYRRREQTAAGPHGTTFFPLFDVFIYFDDIGVFQQGVVHLLVVFVSNRTGFHSGLLSGAFLFRVFPFQVFVFFRSLAWAYAEQWSLELTIAIKFK